MTERSYYISFDGPVVIKPLPGEPGFMPAETVEPQSEEATPAITRDARITAMKGLEMVASRNSEFDASEVFRTLYGSDNRGTRQPQS